jgi:DNA polymerase III gamma/tau subunit
VVFILATTEINKVPETIVSRTQRFTFKAIDETSTIKHLASIAKAEHITIDDEALRLLAMQGDGSFRDSISLLDQASANGEAITGESVRQLLGIVPKTTLDELMHALETFNPSTVLKTLQELTAWGYKPASIAKQLSSVLREQLHSQSGALSPQNIIALLEKLLKIQASPNPALELELALLGSVLGESRTETIIASEVNQPVATKKPLPAPKEPVVSTPEVKHDMAPVEVQKPTPKREPSPLAESWSLVLAELKKTHNTLYGIVRMAEPRFDGVDVVLAFQFPFHQKRMSEQKNKQVVLDIILAVSGQNVTLTCVTDKQLVNTPPEHIKPVTVERPIPIEPSEVSGPNPLEHVMNVFGGGEVLES